VPELSNEKKRVSATHIKNVAITGDIKTLLTPSYYEKQRVSVTSSIIPQSYIHPTVRKPSSENQTNLKSEIDLFNSNIEDLEYGTYENKEIVMPRKGIKTSCNFLLTLR
jgi:hypothetical protein